MEKKTKKQLHFIHAVTENREFCKAVNAFFDGKKKFNEEMVKSFFVDEAYKYAELYTKERDQRMFGLEQIIELRSIIISLNNKIITLQGRLFEE